MNIIYATHALNYSKIRALCAESLVQENHSFIIVKLVLFLFFGLCNNEQPYVTFAHIKYYIFRLMTLTMYPPVSQ